MSLKLNFSKVQLLSFSRKPSEGTIKVSCAPTKTVSKALGWDEVPEWQKSACPVGGLAASIVEFTPANSDQAKHAIEITASSVRDFEFVRVQVKKGKTANKAPTYKLELHCAIDFSDPAGAKKLEAYMQTIGESTMRVTYERAAEQTEIPMDDEQESIQ